MNAVERALAKYVQVLEGKEAFASEPVRRAFQAVRRHRFLAGWYHPEIADLRVAYHLVEYDRQRPTPEALSEIYSDHAIITQTDGFAPTSSTSQPLLVARMLELLDLEPGMRVLEIGTGTGYNAALLAEIVGSKGTICTVDVQEDVARRAETYLQDEGYGSVRVFCRDGYLGAPEAAPFDRIVATVGCSDLSEHWLEQLADGGTMLVPLQHGLSDPLVRLTKDPDSSMGARGGVVDSSNFMPIQGALTWTTPWRDTLILGLPETPTWSRPLPDTLATDVDTAHPLKDDRHQAFAFFLALAYRPLWYTNTGYGLADPGTSSVVTVTCDSIEGYTAVPARSGLDSLHDALLSLLEMWTDLGQPAPSEYDLSLVPKANLGLSVPQGGTPGREWLIGRPFFREIVRLPADDRTSAGNGRNRPLTRR